MRFGFGFCLGLYVYVSLVDFVMYDFLFIRGLKFVVRIDLCLIILGAMKVVSNI